MISANIRIRNSPNINRTREGQTPLLLAAMKGHKEVVEMLLAMDGIDLNPEDPEYGRTPLLWAKVNGHEEIVELLLAKDSVMVVIGILRF
jgi:ankyrin repeat protein